MRRFSKISGMTIVQCDHMHGVRFPGEPRTCGEEFRSCSDKSVIPKQLELAHWKTVKHNGAEEDLCPHHAAAHGLGAKRMPEKRTW